LDVGRWALERLLANAFEVEHLVFSPLPLNKKAAEPFMRLAAFD
jgi:hypothetical protein